MKKIVYIDMDGVLCDYKARFDQKRNENPETPYPQAQYGFFANLDPIPNAINSFKLLRTKFEVFILTAPSINNPLCYTEKRVWVEKHLDMEAVDRLIICKHKGLLMGDYLIDDLEHPLFQGEQIHFGTMIHPNWDSVINYLFKS